MKPSVFEVVIDHNDDRHHDQMNRLARELRDWAATLSTTKLIREQQEIRPGVFRIRFKPDTRALRTRLCADRLSLSRA
jgi:hypothetical protein